MDTTVTTEAMKKVMKCLQEVKKVYLTLMIVTQSMRIPQIFMLHHVQWIDLSLGEGGLVDFMEKEEEMTFYLITLLALKGQCRSFA